MALYVHDIYYLLAGYILPSAAVRSCAGVLWRTGELPATVVIQPPIIPRCEISPVPVQGQKSGLFLHFSKLRNFVLQNLKL